MNCKKIKSDLVAITVLAREAADALDNGNTGREFLDCLDSLDEASAAIRARIVGFDDDDRLPCPCCGTSEPECNCYAD